MLTYPPCGLASGGGTRGLWWDHLLGEAVRSEREVHPENAVAELRVASPQRGTRKRSSIPETSAVAEAQMLADMEAMMVRVMQTEHASLKNETSDLSCAESRSFQFSTYMGSAKSIEALRWAAMEENPIKAGTVRTQGFEDHNLRLCVAQHFSSKPAPW